MWFNIIFVYILTIGCCAANTSRPIIGIVAQELSTSLRKHYSQYSSYIVASYVKAVESSGAQVVPIPINKPESYYRDLLSSINGVVLPGGAATNGPGHPYYDTISTVYKIAKELNDKNIFFPILGVCLGLEFMITIANSGTNFLYKCNVFNENLPLKFVQPYTETNFFSTLDPELYKLLTGKNLTVNWHFWCALVDDFNKQPLLRDDWTITSLSTSFNNLEFIASLEHKKYPFFAVQFHPEKASFEWSRQKQYPHSEQAVIANRFFYHQLVHFARQNDQKFNDTKVECELLIYNYPVTYTQERGTPFTQIYLNPCSDCSTVSSSMSISRSLVVSALLGIFLVL